MKRETLEELITYAFAPCCGNCKEASYNDEDMLICQKYDFEVGACNICDGIEFDEDAV